MISINVPDDGLLKRRWLVRQREERAGKTSESPCALLADRLLRDLDAGRRRIERMRTGPVIPTEVGWMERTTDRSSQGVCRAHGHNHGSSIRARKIKP